MRLRSFATIGLLLVPALLLAPPAAADHPYCIQNTHYFMGGTMTRTLAPRQVNVWGLVPLTVGLPRVQVSVTAGEASVWVTEPQSCRVFVCEDVATPTRPLTCFVPPGYWDVIIQNTGSVSLTYSLRLG